MDILNLSKGQVTNLFCFIKDEAGEDITFRTSKNYNNLEEATEHSSVIPDAGWRFVATIPAGLTDIQTNVRFIPAK